MHILHEVQESVIGYKFTSISPEYEFIYVKLKMLRLNDTINTDYRTFEITPKVLYIVRMYFATHVFSHVVSYE